MVINFQNTNFNIRLIDGSGKILFITHHGLKSNNTSWRYFERWINGKYPILSFDARSNGKDKKRATRMHWTYVRDLRKIILWAKEKYRNHKIILLGSSWGASVVLNLERKYPNLVDYTIAWSIPHKMFRSEDAINNIDAAKNNKISENKITTNYGYTWRLILMLIFNINFKVITKIDLERTANNKLLARMNKIQKPSPTPIKLFYSCWKSIHASYKSIKVINKRDYQKVYYLQSKGDSYFKKTKVDFIVKNVGCGIKYKEFAKKMHAFQWETEENFNYKFFKMIFSFIGEKC